MTASQTFLLEQLMNEQLEQVPIPAGTVIHFKGMPFALAADAIVFGRQENLDAAIFYENAMRQQAASELWLHAQTNLRRTAEDASQAISGNFAR
jgi:hypothetical protein